MPNYKTDRALMVRCGKLGDRVTERITSIMQRPGPKPELDRLFDLSHRQHVLFMRINARYEAHKPESMRDL